MKLKFFIIVAIVLSFICCRENKKTIETQKIIKEWTEKTIQFPPIGCFYPSGKDSISEKYFQPKEYKILFYIDSAGCTMCRLGLEVWKIYIEELGNKVDFLFYLHPETTKQQFYLKELKSVFQYTHFNYPVYIDTRNELNALNKLPENPQFQCFLLDKNNKVLAIGNPADNPKIWELYKKIITTDNCKQQFLTTVEEEAIEIVLKDLHRGKTSEAVFKLKNTGNNPLVIRMVESSCGCTIAEWHKQPVEPEKTTEIKIKITPYEHGYF
jgi:hypothetical protein